MPILKSARKKVRQDKTKKAVNDAYKRAYKKGMKAVEKAKGTSGKRQALSKSYSSIDKAAKKGVMHKNKAARLKSKVAQRARTSK